MFRLTSLFDLTGKTALVTGGNSGIGLAMARALGLAGAHLVLVARREDALREAAEGLRAEGIATDSVAADLASPEAGATLVAACERLGRTIDILVNVAGLNLRQPFMQVSAEGFDLHMAVHLRAPFLLTQAFAPAMAQRGYGRIVNIASLAGKEGTPTLSAYSAAKAGVIALTKAHGKELAGTGVLVNAVAPAAIETELLQQMSAETVATMIGKSPLKRLGTVEELAELVAWLASEKCSFSTGAVFDLSGGRATY
jgi:NAD(P)-dependent dehydrogenase (short-subunit alcohol dehydrogenase family)